MKKRLFLSFLSFLTSINLFSGVEPIEKIIPVSPNAASLGLYGSIPVGHYTGVSKISIPLYEIDLDGKKFPISISYHASGIKVGQEASWVGLGWALNIGGSITREMKGWDDFYSGTHPRGYYFDRDFPTCDNNNDIDVRYGDQERQKYFNIGNNQVDSEPDLFHFCFGDYAGTMFVDKIDQAGNSEKSAKAIIRNSKEYMDATYDIQNNTWTIYDGFGYCYIFRTFETSHMYSTTTSSPIIPVSGKNIREYIQERILRPINTTAWMLDCIRSPLGNEVKFEYDFEEIYTIPQMSEDISILVYGEISHIQGDGFVDPNLISQYKYYTHSYAKIKQALLKKVSFNGGGFF